MELEHFADENRKQGEAGERGIVCVIFPVCQ